jgi:hypothetical protein
VIFVCPHDLLLPVDYYALLIGCMAWIPLIDFGLVILIWLIQLVVYPSFQYLPPTELLQWHRAYTARITVVVMPLMLAQLVLHAWRCVSNFSFSSAGLLALVMGTWIATMTIFVPLHQKISTGAVPATTLAKLVAYNWIRTLLWTMVFIGGICWSGAQ